MIRLENPSVVVRFVNGGRFSYLLWSTMDVYTINEVYHLTDDYFSDAEKYLGTARNGLLSNKDGRRPYFLCLEDAENSDILWAVPLSTRVDKYKKLVEKKINRYGVCDTIVLGRFAGNECAFLIQNMFPICKEYIASVHTVGGTPVTVHKKLKAEIVSKAKRTLNIYRTNKFILFSDADTLYSMILEKLQKTT